MAWQGSSTDIPGLTDWLEQRAQEGRDAYDEWWDGVHWIIGTPSAQRLQLADGLAQFLLAAAETSTLTVVSYVGLGDAANFRKPDIAVVNPAEKGEFLGSAELVVEILPPNQKPGTKLGFYDEWAVKEYLEIDQRAATARLLTNDQAEASNWRPVGSSRVLDLLVTSHRLIRRDTEVLDLRHYRP